MTNPWLKKNPFLSVWLTAANTALGVAQNSARAAAARQSSAALNEANRQVVQFWSAALGAPVKKAATKKSRK